VYDGAALEQERTREAVQTMRLDGFDATMGCECGIGAPEDVF
jgi:hypothetical protein